MNEENPALTQPPASERPASTLPPPAAGRPPGRGGAAWAAALAFIAIAGVALLGWQTYEMRNRVLEVRGELATRLASADAAATEVRALARQQQESIDGLQGKLGALEAKLQATEGQAAALEALYQEFSRSTEDRVLAEVEQALSAATQQLQLAGNVEAALIALQSAEARLAVQDRGQLQPLRRALAKDIEAVKALPQVDIGALALRLEGLLEKVDQLPLAFAATPVAAPSSADDQAAPAAGGSDIPALEFVTGLARDVWRELQSLVRIERLDQSDPVLLAPAQSTFLRENLKIRLLTARLALLGRDGRTFSADLAQARGWIERFFDMRDEAVRNAVSELRALESVPLSVTMISPDESLAALKRVQARNGEQRGSAEPPAPEQVPAAPAPAAPAPNAARP